MGRVGWVVFFEEVGGCFGKEGGRIFGIVRVEVRKWGYGLFGESKEGYCGVEYREVWYGRWSENGRGLSEGLEVTARFLVLILSVVVWIGLFFNRFFLVVSRRIDWRDYYVLGRLEGRLFRWFR